VPAPEPRTLFAANVSARTSFTSGVLARTPATVFRTSLRNFSRSLFNAGSLFDSDLNAPAVITLGCPSTPIREICGLATWAGVA
jgi:hypothetical protein